MSIQGVTNQPELKESRPDVMVGSSSDEETYKLIAHRAHEIYQQRGAEIGDELSDWLKAEIEIWELLPRPHALT